MFFLMIWLATNTMHKPVCAAAKYPSFFLYLLTNLKFS